MRSAVATSVRVASLSNAIAVALRPIIAAVFGIARITREADAACRRVAIFKPVTTEIRSFPTSELPACCKALRASAGFTQSTTVSAAAPASAFETAEHTPVAETSVSRPDCERLETIISEAEQRFARSAPWINAMAIFPAPRKAYFMPAKVRLSPAGARSFAVRTDACDDAVQSRWKEFATNRRLDYQFPMIEHLFRPFGLIIPAIWLAACASSPQVDPAIATALSSRGVEQSTYAKVTQGVALGYGDILNLVRKDVPTHVIISSLQSTQRVYNFDNAQLQGLKNAGASPQLLNYLAETQGFYGVNTPRQSARLTGEQRRAYYDTPGYQAQQPFGTPSLEAWADPGYEESLYSPFSFN